MSEPDKNSSLKDLCGPGSHEACQEGNSTATIILAIVGALLFLELLFYCWYLIKDPPKLNLKSFAQWCKRWSMKPRQQTLSSSPPSSKHQVTVWLPPQDNFPRKEEKTDTKDVQACKLPANTTKALSTFHSYVSKCGVLCMDARPQQDQRMSTGDSTTNGRAKTAAKTTNLKWKMETDSKMTEKLPMPGQATRVKAKAQLRGPTVAKKTFHSVAAREQTRPVEINKLDKAKSHSREKDYLIDNQLVRSCMLHPPGAPTGALDRSEEKKLEDIVSSTALAEVGLLSQKFAKKIKHTESLPSSQCDKPAVSPIPLESRSDGTLVKVRINHDVQPRSRPNSPESPWIMVSADRNQPALPPQEEVDFSKPLLNVRGTLTWLSSGIGNVLPVTSLAVWWNSTASSIQEHTRDISPPRKNPTMEDDLHTSFYPPPLHGSDKEFPEPI